MKEPVPQWLSGATRIASLLAALIGGTTTAFADDVDWRLYGGATVENAPEICFFDAKGVTQENVGQLRVWTKCLDQKELGNVHLDEASLKKAARKTLSGYVPPIVTIGVLKSDQINDVLIAEETANLDNIRPRSRILLEFDCVEQKVRTLSTYVKTNNGQEGFSRKPGDWDYISPETNVAYLQKILCR
jgi:hypothetical protein